MENGSATWRVSYLQGWNRFNVYIVLQAHVYMNTSHPS